MQRVLVTAPLLLICSFACRHAPPGASAQSDAGSAGLTSAVVVSPSDDEIVTSFQQAMVKSRAIEPHSGDVQATASGGIVTLEGHVDSESAKQRIHDLALQTPGVKTVVDALIAPEANPSLTNDTTMTQAIRERLAERQADNVKVTTIGGKVILEGSVPTEVEKRQIVSLAEHTPNVASVDNRLVIRPLAKF